MDEQMRVLIAAKSSTVRRITKNLFRQIGFNNVDEVSDGASALQAIRERRVNLVVAGGDVPPEGGIHLTREIRADPQGRDTSILLILTDLSQQEAIQAKEAGVDDWIVMPFDSKTLKRKLEGIFGG